MKMLSKPATTRRQRTPSVLELDRNYSKVVIFSKYPKSHPFHRALSHSRAALHESRRLFRPLRDRHRFTILVFAVISAVWTVPTAAMTLAYAHPELREKCETYKLDLVAFVFDGLGDGPAPVRQAVAGVHVHVSSHSANETSSPSAPSLSSGMWNRVRLAK